MKISPEVERFIAYETGAIPIGKADGTAKLDLQCNNPYCFEKDRKKKAKRQRSGWCEIPGFREVD